jgi:hypothetical protein
MCRVSASRLSIYNFVWGLLKATKKVYLIPQKWKNKDTYGIYPTKFASPKTWRIYRNTKLSNFQTIQTVWWCTPKSVLSCTVWSSTFLKFLKKTLKHFAVKYLQIFSKTSTLISFRQSSKILSILSINIHILFKYFHTLQKSRQSLIIKTLTIKNGY